MASMLKWRDDWDDEEAEVAALQRLADEKSEDEDDDDEYETDEEDGEELGQVKREADGKCEEIQLSTEDDSKEIITSDMSSPVSTPIVIAATNEDSNGMTCHDPSDASDLPSPDSEERKLEQFSVVVENPVASSPLELTDLERPEFSDKNVCANQVICPE